MALKDFMTDFQHIGIPTNDLDATITFYEQLGFQVLGRFENGPKHFAFLQFGHLTIEAWDGGEVVATDGAINHFCMDTNDIEGAYEAAVSMNLEFVKPGIQDIPTFWDNGTRIFKFYGPNREVIEVCEIG